MSEIRKCLDCRGIDNQYPARREQGWLWLAVTFNLHATYHLSRLSLLRRLPERSKLYMGDTACGLDFYHTEEDE